MLASYRSRPTLEKGFVMRPDGFVDLVVLAWIARRLLSVHLVGHRCVKRGLAFRLRIVRMHRYISLPMDTVLLVASFAPLAGARMMCTGRGSYQVCDFFLRSVQDKRGLRGEYLSALCRFLRANVRRQVVTIGLGLCVLADADLEMQIAAVAELGGDPDLVFALAWILKQIVAEQHGHRVSDYWTSGVVWHGLLGSPVFAACGPTDSDAVVSLLIRLGAPVADRVRCVTAAGVVIYESALCRAVRLKKPSTVCMLLRASALEMEKGWYRRFTEVGVVMGRWESALARAVVGGHCGIVKALLEARACPSKANAVKYQGRRVAGRRCVGKLSAWECTDSGRVRGAFVLEAFLACERRCCCNGCEHVFKYRDYR